MRPLNQALDPSLVMILRYSVPVVLLLLNDIYDEIFKGEGIFVKEMSGSCQGNASFRFCQTPWYVSYQQV